MTSFQTSDTSDTVIKFIWRDEFLRFYFSKVSVAPGLTIVPNQLIDQATTGSFQKHYTPLEEFK